MKLLVTGAFGNVGGSFLQEVAGRGHDVLCFDVDSRANRAAARRAGVTAVWGDIRDPDAVLRAVAGRDAVVHLAAVIPPGSIHDPELAEQVNVQGTANVIAACRALAAPPRIAFASSVALYGPTQHLDPPRTLADPLHPTDDYTRHKFRCEELLRESGLEVAVLRLGAVIPIDVLGVLDPIMFEVPLTDRVEFVHPADVALAFVHAVESDHVWGRTFLIGGGPRCQLRQFDIVQRPLVALGIGELPAEAFGTTPFQIDWVDTTESQEVLRYQRHDFDDCIADMLAMLGWKRPFVKAARPLARRKLLATSPYYRTAARS